MLVLWLRNASEMFLLKPWFGDEVVPGRISYMATPAIAAWVAGQDFKQEECETGNPRPFFKILPREE